MSAAVQRDTPRGPGYGTRALARLALGRLVPKLVLIGIIAVLIAVVWSMGSERRALRALPEPERLAVLARTVDELRQFCGEGRPDALRKHCHDLATFAAQFEECRGECEALVRIELAPPPPR